VRSSLRVRRLLVLLVVLLATPMSFYAQVAQDTVCCHAEHVGPVVMTVLDMNRSVDFYSRVLTFQKISDRERSGREYEVLYGVPGAHLRTVDLKLGDDSIELQQFLGISGAPIPTDARSNDRSFQHIAIIVSNMAEAYRVLRQNHAEHVSSFPQTLPGWNQNAAGIQAFYFKDPDGHPLEILQFPADKGDPKWHRATNRLFLGIDHTAIVVADTEASLAFYRDLLGMRVAGESENYGTEQEHLNNVFGAHLRITSLRSPSGIGIEFLEYIAPRDGMPSPANAAATDIAHHETVIAVDDLDGFGKQSDSAQFAVVSPEINGAQGLPMNANRARLVRDPDGHFLLLVQK
jgi:catechol 2,3-dioxygenase-like lactoylglutathione lyase family enzyme